VRVAGVVVENGLCRRGGAEEGCGEQDGGEGTHKKLYRRRVQEGGDAGPWK
jgi:hypothetical protein